MNDEAKGKATLAARAGGFFDAASGGVVPPIQSSTTFIRDDDYNPLVPGNVYGRDDNDQVRLAEDILCRMEEASDTLLFSSGMAAIGTLLDWLKPGQTLLMQKGIYWGTTAYARRLCERRNIRLVEADSTETETFCNTLQEEQPAIVLVEVPSNPWILMSDIRAIAASCLANGCRLAVDATAATPLLMKPLALGADIVIHSATKAINGHSDVLAGVLSCRTHQDDLWQFIKEQRHDGGAILSAQAAWLLIRGMRTLPLRLERMCSTSQAIADHLENHEKIEDVWYPGLASHEGHELAKRDMDGGYGYLMSFLVRGGRDDALRFCANLKGIHRATSLGGVESLVEHRHTLEGELTGCPENLIRLSVGIEEPEDLLNELDSALSAV